MTPEVAGAIASAFGTEIQAGTTDDTPTMLIGSDGRSSGPQFVEAARKGLAATGCRVIDLGIVTTTDRRRDDPRS